MRKSTQRLNLFPLALTLSLTAHSAESLSSLEQGFRSPPDSARPWVFWFWLNGNISSNGITADLESMKRVGIVGVSIMDAVQGTPKGPAAFGTPAWLNLFKHTCAEAHRLGMKVEFNDDPGWSGSGGPWVTPELSMQKVVWSETTVEGPRHFDGIIPQPQSYVITTNRAPAGPISFGSGGLAAREDDKVDASNTNTFYRDISVFAFP